MERIARQRRFIKSYLNNGLEYKILFISFGSKWFIISNDLGLQFKHNFGSIILFMSILFNIVKSLSNIDILIEPIIINMSLEQFKRNYEKS